MITLLHPSRGRAQKSFENAKEWINNSSSQIELIVSLDKSDDWNKYFEFYGFCDFNERVKFQMIVNNNSSVVEATNAAAKKSNGDILVYLSDDFKSFKGWDEKIIDEFKNERRPLLIKVDDCLQQFDVAVLTIPIMNRLLYEKLGYFWHPSYKSMFVDEDLYWTAHRIGAIKKCPHLRFEHQHCSVGKSENDETYRASAANWEQGKLVFSNRKILSFPL